MGAMAAIADYFILLPMFQIFMPMDQLVAAFAEFIPFLHTKLDVVLLHALPLELFSKGWSFRSSLWYNNGGIAVIIRFEVVFLAAGAATEKHDKLYHSRLAAMVLYKRLSPILKGRK